MSAAQTSATSDSATTHAATADAARLLSLWDAQQGAYITHREARFEIMLDVIAQHCAGRPDTDPQGSGLTVLDLACGPGSLSHRVLDRFPGAHVVGLDYDPVLLAIATAALSQPHGDRFTAVDADLADPESWTAALGGCAIDVAVSSTALHWLSPAELVALYGTLGTLLPEEGLVMNADHLRYSPSKQPLLSALAAHDDQRTQRISHAEGALTWDQWWSEAITNPGFGTHESERERRFADRPPTPHAPVELHLQALTTAGFREAGEIWRHYDDVVLLGRR